MKHLIIFAHPNGESSFNRAILDSVQKASEKIGAECMVRDLYQMPFNPVLTLQELQQGVPEEILYEQTLWKKADFISLIYPLWWMGFPAILKGYLDRVLSFGFAYGEEKGHSVGLLSEVKMHHIITIGNSVADYQQLGFTRSLKDCLVDGLFNFCGIRHISHQLLGSIHELSTEERHTLLLQVEEQTLKNLEKTYD